MNPTASNTLDATWVKSSHSNGNGGNCVEWAPAIAAAGDAVPIRDSKAPSVVLVFPAGSWTRFVAATGEGRTPGTGTGTGTGTVGD